MTRNPNGLTILMHELDTANIPWVTLRLSHTINDLRTINFTYMEAGKEVEADIEAGSCLTTRRTLSDLQKIAAGRFIEWYVNKFNVIPTPRKNCPFCGSYPSCEGHDDNGWFIGCVNIECPFRPSAWEDDELSATKAWNQRKEDIT